MKKHYIFSLSIIIVCTLGVTTMHAQGVAVNATGTVADASAMLDVNSNTQGMLVPRMDSAHRVGISAPATGLLVYQTDGVAPGFYFKAASGWQSLSAAANTTTQGNTFNGANQLAQLDGSGKLATSALPSTVTTAGNTFNTASNLVKLDGSTNLPAVGGAQLTNLNGANLSANSVTIGKLPSGASSSTFLRGDGTWAIPGGSFGITKTTSSNYAILATDNLVVYDGADSIVTFTLPSSVSAGAGRIYYLSNTTTAIATTYINTLNLTGTDQINNPNNGGFNSTSYVVTNWFALIVISDGAGKWIVISQS